VLAALAAAIGAGCGSDETPAPSAAEPPPSSAAEPAGPAQAPSEADLSGVKAYLLEHTELLTGFTGSFLEIAQRLHTLAEDAGGAAALWRSSPGDVAPLLEQAKRLWIEGNPYYERMEGIVAGVPELSEFDVSIDAGGSAAEDPASAVPFDIVTADGRTFEQPGNLYGLAEAALWGTNPDYVAPGVQADLDGDGSVEFGEAVPDPAFLLAVAEEFERQATALAAAAEAWEPQPSDAFTALVVMVPTMSEYFGQWKESRFVAGEAATSEVFNVVSRLSDINDIIGGLEVIYEGVRPAVAASDAAQADQTGRALTDLRDFVGDLYAQEGDGKRFTPEEADLLGTEAQDRATAVAGQISQVAAMLGVQIAQ
jgi:hypothetical protein